MLRMLNQIIESNKEIQENLCLVGGIPTVLRYAHKQYNKEIRLEAARFVKQMCSTSTLTLQMFIACRGLPVLVSLIENDSYTEHKDLVFMAIDGVGSVFELQVRCCPPAALLVSLHFAAASSCRSQPFFCCTLIGADLVACWLFAGRVRRPRTISVGCLCAAGCCGR